MQLYKRGKLWWVRFSHDGKQHRLSTGKEKKSEAQTVAAVLLQKVERGDDPHALPTRPPTVKEFAAGPFTEWVEASRNLQPKSKQSYLYGLSLLARQDLYGKRMDAVTPEDADMMRIPGSASTFNCAVRTLRRIFGLALAAGRVQRCPRFKTIKEHGRKEVIRADEERAIAEILASTRIGRQNGSIRNAYPLSLEMGLLPHEIARLRVENIDFAAGVINLPTSGRAVPMTPGALEAMKKQCRGKSEWVFPSPNMPGKPINRQSVTKALRRSRRGASQSPALQVAWPVHMDTGMRPHEMVNLRIENLDFVKGTIYIQTTKSEAGFRYVPMSDRVKKILFEHIGGKTEGWVFPSPKHRGKPITRAALTAAFAKARTLAGISKSKKLYSARHTFGTDVMSAVRDPKFVMGIMGHSDLKMTMNYLHPETDKAASLINDRNRERLAELDDSKPPN